MNNPSEQSKLLELRQLSTIRRQCQKLYGAAVAGQLKHFSVNEQRLSAVADFILDLIQTDYPTLDIPFHSRWRHFEAGGIPRHLQLDASWQNVSPTERVRRHIDLVVVSVLLDAGAGAQWRFTEHETGQVHGRSEGLGLASLKMFSAGHFSSDSSNPHQVDAVGLSRLTLDQLKSGFQVSDSNPLLGLEGRLSLLHKLGAAIKNKSQVFSGKGEARPGFLFDAVLGDGASREIPLFRLWHAVIDGLEEVWPKEGRIQLAGHNLGDAWRHAQLGDLDTVDSIIPFHKLSQWLTYSLLEPLISAGYSVTGLNELTGLPEYRNGGLFLDFDVLVLKNPQSVERAHPVDSELIVEWRALTVVLLDKTAELIRSRLNKTEQEFPLAKALEAGTWKAGRRIAAQRRAGGQPPLQVISDGTVF